ncbi:hypothetical protein R1sor_001732 [Riccia sorocarpa]|uniref:DUF2231 domain-containing protein n=1 Tax=Riccia sorocarpa TaxID=122646 RepID=A0ABD3H065_9MARC
MPLSSKMGRTVAAPLLALNLAMGSFGGNAATPFLTLVSLLAGMTGIAAIITGLHHLRLWRGSSGAAAQSTAWITWLLLVLAFCLAWKEIRIGGRSVRHRVLEAFIIILTLTHLLYTLALHIGDDHPDTTHTPAVDKHHHNTVPPSHNTMAASAV